MCSCKATLFLHCANFNTQRQALFDKIATTLAKHILTENKDRNENSFNKSMLNTSTEFILPT